MAELIATAATTAALIASAYGCTSTSNETDKASSAAAQSDHEPRSKSDSTVVSDVFGMFADWEIPSSVSDVVRSSSPDAQLLGVPIGATLGNEYTFDDGRGGTISTAYFNVEVRESSAPGPVPGDTATVEVPMPTGTTAETLAQIDFGSRPWTFAISSNGVFEGGDVTSVRDLDDQLNPDSLGGTNATAVFQVSEDDQITLPIIDEPALESVEATSTAGLSDQLEEAIEETN